MATALRETIKNITFKHLKKFKGQVFGQNLTGVGWVAGTLPELYEKDGVIELPLADVANGGMVTGSALVGRRPFYIIRYQGYNWLNCIFIANYACKSKEIWDKPAPMFIRGLSNEGGLGPVSTSSHISIFYKMPGIKIFSPMSNKEYLKIYKKFMQEDEVFYISEHRKSYENKLEFKNTIKKALDIILMPISVTRFEAEKAKNHLNKLGYRVGIIHLFELKPFVLKKKWINAIKKSKYGVLMTDNDYVDGILRTLAHKINEKTDQTVNVMGLKDKSAGYTVKTSNFPPSALDIINKVRVIISKKRRKKKMDKKELINFEEEIASLFNKGKILSPVHLYQGNEEKIINIFKKIKKQDWVFCSWRSHYQCLLKGVPKDIIKKEILDGRSISLCFPDYKIYSSALVGGSIPIAVGTAMSLKLKNERNTMVYCFMGEMTSETGIAHECIKYSRNFDLPIHFVVEDNEKSVCTDTRKTWMQKKLSYEGVNDKFVTFYSYKSKWPHAGAGSRVQF